MPAIEQVPLSELEKMLRTLNLPGNTRVTVRFDDNEAAEKVLKQKRALEAMKKLRGSGNGNLLETLLKERANDKMNA